MTEKPSPEEVPVQCYSGQTYAERPLSFRWHGQEVAVEEVLARWREPAGPVYGVVDDGSPSHPWHECRTDNNVSDPADPACGTVN